MDQRHHCRHLIHRQRSCRQGAYDETKEAAIARGEGSKAPGASWDWSASTGKDHP
jgi:hypothetical protein